MLILEVNLEANIAGATHDLTEVIGKIVYLACFIGVMDRGE